VSRRFLAQLQRAAGVLGRPEPEFHHKWVIGSWLLLWSITVTTLLLPGMYGSTSIRVAIITSVAIVGLVGCLLARAGSLRIGREQDVVLRFVEQLAEGREPVEFPPSATGGLGDVGRALSRLKCRVAGQRDEYQRESTLTRQALDNASASIMLTDESLTIVYTNAAARRLFDAAEADFRRDLPDFKAGSIIGSNMDVFHQDPTRIRLLLTQLQGTHAADIKVGGRGMRIVATPVKSVEGQRIGTVVEWFDRTQEIRAEEEISAIVRGALDGELAGRVALEGKAGFLQVLARGVNLLIDNMVAIILNAKSAATEVGKAAKAISEGNSDLAQRTEGQSSALERTARSMEEMTRAVRHTADSAGQANDLAIAARERAENGGAVVGKTVEAMAQIDTASKRIAEIIGRIDEVAFQTNLLALNAAVEAARAGEQGRGFAIVAAEVRNLASRSAVAAKEIKTLIHDSVRKVESGTALVTASGETLTEIMASIKKVADIVGEIAAASQLQSGGIVQVNKSIMEMDEMTEQNAALVEQAATASRKLSEQASQLVELMSCYALGEAGTQNAGGGPQAVVA
jgi:methyl-accepting chemotaxis protein